VDTAQARVEVDGRRVEIEPKQYILLNKPRGPLSTVMDGRGRQTVLDLLGERGERIFPVGRLDADTEGLLLITNDGGLTYRLTHPRYQVEKVYEAEVKGQPSRAVLRQVEQGARLPEGSTGPVQVRVLRAARDRSILELTVHTGRKRMIRRMLKAVGHPVVALRRTRLGPLTLGGLRPGRWRHLTEDEVAALEICTREEAAPHVGTARSTVRRRSRRRT
jgi:pseudouridine synthase